MLRINNSRAPASHHGRRLAVQDDRINDRWLFFSEAQVVSGGPSLFKLQGPRVARICTDGSCRRRMLCNAPMLHMDSVICTDYRVIVPNRGWCGRFDRPPLAACTLYICTLVRYILSLYLPRRNCRAWYIRTSGCRYIHRLRTPAVPTCSSTSTARHSSCSFQVRCRRTPPWSWPTGSSFCTCCSACIFSPCPLLILSEYP